MNRDPLEKKFAVFCFLLGIAICIIVSLNGCATSRYSSSVPPPVDVKSWSGDSSANGITRNQLDSISMTLQCKDPLFDEYVCMTYMDLKKIHSTLYQCKEW